MAFPLIVHTDASLEYGNNTPAEMVERAVKTGYNRVLIADVNAMCANIKFLNQCKAHNVEPIVGAHVTVTLPLRDNTLWALRHHDVLSAFFAAAGSPTLARAETYERIQACKEALEKCKKSKAAARFDVLNATLEELLSSVSLPSNEEALTDFVKYWFVRLKELPGLEMSEVLCVAKNTEGYRSVMRIASLHSLHKYHNIHQPDAAPKALAADWAELGEEKAHIAVVEPGTERGPLSAFAPYLASGALSVSDFAALVGTLSSHLDAIGVSLGWMAGMTSYYDAIRPFQDDFMLIPTPIARYGHPDEYEAYCAKVSVHRGVPVTSLTFTPPPKSAHVSPVSEAQRAYAAWEEEMGLSLMHGFWDAIAGTVVPLGEVHLPSYDMPVLDVVRYAYAHMKQSCPALDDEAAALAAFDQLIQGDCPEGTTPEAFRQRRLDDFCLHKLSYEGVLRRVAENFGEQADEHLPEYLARHKHEFSVIEGMGFSGYFLIDYDIIESARNMRVPVGDGRGSGAGSLIVYALELTDVDPLEYDLQFERFLNPERVSMPDIDVDFGEGGDADRGTVLEYINKKYEVPGAKFPSSSQIANIMRYGVKSAVPAIRKAYGLSMQFDAYLKGLIERAEVAYGVSAPEVIKWDDFMAFEETENAVRNHPVLRKVLLLARALTGKMSGFSTHAGGVVIAPSPVTDFSVVSCDDKGAFFSQYDKDDIESAGLIKFDILGLRTLSIIEETVHQIKRSRGIDIDPRKLDKHDPKVFELLCNQTLSDVFQLESAGMRELVGNLQPQNIGEIGVLSALFRPGALQSGMVEEFIDVKFGRKPATYDHPALETVTDETFGCIVYQEQVMSIVRELAGYSLGEADLLRRAMGKKKIEEMNKQKKVYNGRAMSFWREHFINVGKDKGFDVTLDVNLRDLQGPLEAIDVWEFVDDDGYLSSMEGNIALLKTLLKLGTDQEETLRRRLSDFNYVLRLFKQDYQQPIEMAFANKFPDMDATERKALQTRVYFALSQFVRFNQIFNKIEKFAGYGFNKSHAIAYSVITYKSAYLKTHYPAEFYAAALTYKDLDHMYATVAEATQKMGVKLLGPDINVSGDRFNAEGTRAVRYGLKKLREMKNAAALIVQEREANGDYLGVVDFLERMQREKIKVNVSGFHSLSVSGAFDRFIPERIRSASELNGRAYIAWLRDNVSATKANLEPGKVSDVHARVDEMSDASWMVYLLSVCTPAKLKKAFGDKMPAATLGFIIKKPSVPLLAAAKSHLLEHATEWITECPVIQSLLAKPISELSPFEARFVAVAQTLFELFALRLNAEALLSVVMHNAKDETWLDCRFVQSLMLNGADIARYNDFFTLFDDWLTDALNVPVAKTLNEERHVAGMYITSNPLKVMKIEQRVQKEPPSSIIDGCPVEVRLIDASYHEQRVTTYGIVRDPHIKRVKKESSKWLDEKMLFFTLESGSYEVSCMIFGNKQADMFVKLLEDGHVVMVGGEVRASDFGVTIDAKAMKRYYPDEDDKMLVVPKLRRN
jgi:DNA polymerase III alpha subunit